MSELTYEQKLVNYATAPKVTAGVIWQKENGKLVKYWCGRLRGQFVQAGTTWKSETKRQALEDARLFRDQCLEEAKTKGLIAA